MTGLANRHLLLDRFRLAVDNLDRHPGAIVVLHIDLDRFKDVNDTYGHSVGDHVLAEVGRRLDGLVDSPDTAARLAGDEFVIVTAARRRQHAPPSPAPPPGWRKRSPRCSARRSRFPRTTTSPCS